MRIHTTRLLIRTLDGASMHDITDEVNSFIADARLETAMCVLTARHRECALSLTDSVEDRFDDLIRLARDVVAPRGRRTEVRSDGLDVVPEGGPVGAVVADTLSLPVIDGRLATGSWECVVLLEALGPSERHVDLTLIGR